MSWQESPLGAIADTQLGKMLDAKKNEGEYHPYLGNDNVQWDGIDLSEVKEMRFKESELAKFALRSGDLLVCEGGDPGRCAIWNSDEEMYYQKALHRVRAHEGVLDNRYLYYFLVHIGSTQEICQYYTGGATIKHLPAAALNRVKVRYPDLSTQKRIVGVLSAYDELIENNRRQIKLLEEAAQRLYKEWFVDLKFPGHETTPIHNGLPEGWKRCHLRDVLEINGGKDYKQLKSGTYPVYGSGGLMCRVDSFLYEGESVLIPRKGTLNNVMYRNEAFWTVDTLFYTRVLLKNGGKYLFHAVRAFDFASMNIGAAVPSMTKTKLDGLVLTIPTELFLERFERAVAPFYQAMTVLQQQIAAAREARDRLLPKLMSGETAGCGR